MNCRTMNNSGKIIDMVAQIFTAAGLLYLLGGRKGISGSRSFIILFCFALIIAEIDIKCDKID